MSREAGRLFRRTSRKILYDLDKNSLSKMNPGLDEALIFTKPLAASFLKPAVKVNRFVAVMIVWNMKGTCLFEYERHVPN